MVSVRVDGGVAAVGLPLATVTQIVRRLELIEVVSATAALALLAGLARLLLLRGLRPLEEITATATAIAGGELDRRIVLGPDGRLHGTEVGRLTLAVNGMLGHIQNALAERARSEQRMRDFVADASHELRTPLTSIRGYVQMMRQGMVTVEQRPDMLRRTDEEAARMSSIVDDLIYLARLDIEPALHHEQVDLAVVVRDSLADALAVQPARPSTLSAPQSCAVVGDADALRQVLANLLANVRTHTPPHAAVAVSLTVGAGLARVEVSDHGPGLPPELTSRAFERFVRDRNQRSGSGLGLAIVAGIIAAHGGDVGITGRASGGTTVWFTVPVTNS